MLNHRHKWVFLGSYGGGIADSTAITMLKKAVMAVVSFTFPKNLCIFANEKKK